MHYRDISANVTYVSDISEMRHTSGPARLASTYLWGAGGVYLEAFCSQQASELGANAGPWTRRNVSDLHDADWNGVVTFLDGGRVRKEGGTLLEEARSMRTDAFASLIATSCRVCRGSGLACGAMQHFEQGGGETYYAPLLHPCAACGTTGRVNG